MHESVNRRRSGYGDGEPYRSILIAAGVLVIDSRGAEYGDVARIAIRRPMPGFQEQVARDGFGDGALSYLPAQTIAAEYAAIGAQVFNLQSVRS
jgi:hypothetical protein